MKTIYALNRSSRIIEKILNKQRIIQDIFCLGYPETDLSEKCVQNASSTERVSKENGMLKGFVKGKSVVKPTEKTFKPRLIHRPTKPHRRQRVQSTNISHPRANNRWNPSQPMRRETYMRHGTANQYKWNYRSNRPHQGGNQRNGYSPRNWHAHCHGPLPEIII